MPLTLSQWNKLMSDIPEIQEILDRCKNIKLLLEGDLCAITREITDLMYVGLHRCVAQEIMANTGINLTMKEWTVILAVMQIITGELNESHLKPHQFHLYNLIHLIYTLERYMIAAAHYICFGCDNDSPGQLSHVKQMRQ